MAEHQYHHGTPAFVFYDKEVKNPETGEVTGSGLCFVWDGKAPTVEVSKPQDPEAAFESFEIDKIARLANATATKWMQWFQLACFNFIRLKVDS